MMSRRTLLGTLLHTPLVRLVLPLTCAGGLLSTPSAATELELYAPAPPAGSAFVRFVNAEQETHPLRLAGRALGALRPGEVSPYWVAAAGTRSASAGKHTSALEVVAGHFYTVLIRAQGLHPLKDETHTHLAKAQLALYNVSALKQVSLKTADGAATILEGITPGGHASRSVNAIAVELAVHGDGKELHRLSGLNLAQGSAYSVFVLPGGSKPTVQWVPNRTETTR